jgi:UDP-glucose 4-epimerase
MQVLVTGGLGFVGSNLVDTLVDMGHKVTVIDNLSSESSRESFTNKSARYFIDDIREMKESVPDHVGQFDVIYHLAGMARIQPSFKDPVEYIDVNVVGTSKICQLAKTMGARLVYASSSSINNGEYKTPYTFSKWGGEEVIKTWKECYNINAAICRFYNVYGPREPRTGTYATVVQKFIRQYLDGQRLTIVGDGEQRRDFTHVDDIVNGLITVGELDTVEKNNLYHLGRGVNYSINDLVAMFGDADIKKVPLRQGEGRVTLADYEETFNRLGWRAEHNLEDYIKTQIRK